MRPEEARRRFEEARVARLATVTPDGRPHVVPVVYAVDGDTIHTAVDPKTKSSRALARLANVAAHREVALLVDAYDEDWSRLWWVRADGVARVVPSGAERDRAIELLRARYPQYATLAAGADDFGPALVIRVERWTGWSAG